MVLFAALALMAIVGLLIGATLASSTLAERSTRLTRTDAELTAAADLAVNTVLGEARARGLASLPLGQAVVFTDVPADGRVSASVSATRLPRDVLWLVGDARTPDGGSHRVNVVARWHVVGAAPSSPLVARGNIRLGSSVTFATDTTGDTDCAVRAPNPTVLLGPGATLTTVDTVPARVDRRAADSSTYLLATGQRVVLDTMPGVVRVRGDTVVYGGLFDGVMLVDGSLTIAGSWSGTGILVVRDSIDARMGTLNFTGAVMAFSAPQSGGFSMDIVAATIRYSPCIISRALRGAARLRPVGQRSWSEIF